MSQYILLILRNIKIHFGFCCTTFKKHVALSRFDLTAISSAKMDGNAATLAYGNFKITTAASETRVTTMVTSVVIMGITTPDRFALLGIERSKQFFVELII